MSYEVLSLIGFVNEVKNASSGPHPRKFCFVLGAGTSRTSGIKSGQELVSIWESELQERNSATHVEWKTSLGINEDNQDQFYSQYYERRFHRHPEDGYNFLEKMMEMAKPSVGYVMLAYVLTETIHNVVITTNFDHLTENAINYYQNKIPLTIGHESLSHYITRQKQISRPTIIKIHRDLLFDPKNEVKEVSKLHDNWERALYKIFSEYHPVFIGYAGNDKSLMDFLLNNSDRFQSREWLCPYWLLYKTDAMNEQVQKFLVSSEGYIIRHDGFDEVLYLLGAALGYQIPDEAEFMQEAEKRYHDIAEAIDGFSAKDSETNKIIFLETAEHNEVVDEGEKLSIIRRHEITGSKADLATDDQTKQSLKEAIQHVTGQRDLQRLFRESVELFDEGKYEEALEILQKLVEQVPNNARYQHTLGRVLYSMGKYEEALTSHLIAVDIESQDADYCYWVAETLIKLDKNEESIAYYQKCVEIEPENGFYHFCLGDTFDELERIEDAYDSLLKAISLDPEEGLYHCRLSEILKQKGKYDDAILEMERALKLEPDDDFYYFIYSILLNEVGEPQKACSQLLRAIEINPNEAVYRYSLSQLLQNAGDISGAVEAIKNAIKLDINNLNYKKKLVLLLTQNKDNLAIKDQLLELIELEPTNSMYRKMLQEIMEKDGATGTEIAIKEHVQETEQSVL